MTVFNIAEKGCQFINVKNGVAFSASKSSFNNSQDFSNFALIKTALEDGVYDSKTMLKLPEGSQAERIKGRMAFPELKNPETFYPLDISIVLKLLPYVSDDTTRPFMNGIRVGDNGDIVATDGKRMAIAKSDIKPEKEFILPGKYLKKLFSAYKKEDFSIGFAQDMVFIKSYSTTLYLKEIEGQFPYYKRVIPTYAEGETETIIFNDDFKNVLKDAIKGMGKLRRVFFTEKGVIHESKYGYIKVYGPISKQRFAFNAKFLLDILDNTNIIKVPKKEEWARSAILANDGNADFIVMPMDPSDDSDTVKKLDYFLDTL